MSTITKPEVWKRLSINESKVLKALLKHSTPTKTKHHHQCDIRRAYVSLNMSRYSFAGCVSSLKKKRLYAYVFWSTNPNKTGYKDHPAKSVMIRGYFYTVRSDVAIAIDPVCFEERG
jgi:formylmethanofuran dehydrogenase subunit B